MFANLKHHLRYWGFLLLKFAGAFAGSGFALWFLNLFWAPHTKLFHSAMGEFSFLDLLYTFLAEHLVSVFVPDCSILRSGTSAIAAAPACGVCVCRSSRAHWVLVCCNWDVRSWNTSALTGTRTAERLRVIA